jgi:hypothetical protein
MIALDYPHEAPPAIIGRTLASVGTTTRIRNPITVTSGITIGTPPKPAGCASTRLVLTTYGKRHGYSAVTYWCARSAPMV